MYDDINLEDIFEAVEYGFVDAEEAYALIEACLEDDTDDITVEDIFEAVEYGTIDAQDAMMLIESFDEDEDDYVEERAKWIEWGVKGNQKAQAKEEAIRAFVKANPGVEVPAELRAGINRDILNKFANSSKLTKDQKEKFFAAIASKGPKKSRSQEKGEDKKTIRSLSDKLAASEKKGKIATGAAIGLGATGLGYLGVKAYKKHKAKKAEQGKSAVDKIKDKIKRNKC